MQMLLTFIGSHLLTILENLLIKEEPAIVAMVQTEARLIIAKIESLIQNKSPALATVVTPTLNLVNTMTNDALSSMGNAIAQDANHAL